jgi:hypothetical protein
LPTELIRHRNIGVVYFLDVLDSICGTQGVFMVHEDLFHLVSDPVAFDLVIMIAVDLDAMPLLQRTLPPLTRVKTTLGAGAPSGGKSRNTGTPSKAASRMVLNASLASRRVVVDGIVDTAT